MQDPTLIQPELEPEFTCPECGAALRDESALAAHREQEHIEEVAGTAARPATEAEKAERAKGVLDGKTAANKAEESVRPTQPAP